jgi:carotenoid 1,2-hydratase
LRGREHPSGGGSADGRLVRAAGGRGLHEGPGFDRPVPPGGYAWWYLDAIGDDGQHGLTIIGFLGSVFSPYYLKSGRGDPIDHSCINVALYGPRCGRWAMTERGGGAVARAPDILSVGPSAMRWTGDKLVIDLDERAVTLGSPFHPPVRGRVTLHPESLATAAFALDPNGRHHWRAIAPRARVEVEMAEPALRWKGGGYFDTNWGTEPLEAGFSDWQWSRAHCGREAAVLYEGERRDGSRFAAALRFDGAGNAHEEELPPSASLRPSAWLMGRRTRSDDGRAKVIRTWEDAPFYARSTLSSRLFGSEVAAGPRKPLPHAIRFAGRAVDAALQDAARSLRRLSPKPLVSSEVEKHRRAGRALLDFARSERLRGGLRAGAKG